MMLTPEQLAERLDGYIVTLRKDIEAINGKCVDNKSELLILMLARIDAQQARIAELEKDAARYRWLRNPNQRIDSVIDKRVGELSSGMGIWEYKAGEELDAAIDAAMQPTWPEDTSDYGSRIAIVGQNGNDGLAYQEEQP